MNLFSRIEIKLTQPIIISLTSYRWPIIISVGYISSTRNEYYSLNSNTACISLNFEPYGKFYLNGDLQPALGHDLTAESQGTENSGSVA